MSFNNAVNANQTGIQTLSSAGAWSGSTVTQYGVLVGGATNSVGSTSVGSAGQVMTSNGAGVNPTFQAVGAAGAFSSINVQTFTATGTYTPTASMKYCIIECVGGGGAGGGATTTTFSAGAGGGAGEYAMGVFSAATIGASKSVTIGAGGTGVSAATGNTGGTTTVGATIISAVGGTGGAVVSTVTANGFFLAGGAGGTGGTGGSVRFKGTDGGYLLQHPASSGPAVAGPGASGRFSGGAAAVGSADGSVAQAANGNAATGFGGGGGGALDFAVGTAQTGGAGSAGYVVITEYI